MNEKYNYIIVLSTTLKGKPCHGMFSFLCTVVFSKMLDKNVNPICNWIVLTKDLKFLKCAYSNWGTSYICRTTVGVFGLGRFKIIFWLQIIGLQVICIMCILRNCNYHAHQSNFGKAAAKAIVCKSFSELSLLVQLVTMGALRRTHAH